jgi:hypothetical protein
MALKEKNKAGQDEAAPGLTEERKLRVNPELDARLTRFMEANPKTTDYYTQLVKDNPERAVRALMLGKMLKHEDQMRLVEKQMPKVREWVEQTPGMLEKITERIKDVNPFYKEKAFVNEAMKIKSRLDFTPKVGMGMSV